MVRKLFIVTFCMVNIILYAQKKQQYDENDIAEFQLEDGTSFKAYFIGPVTISSTLGQIIVSNRISGFKYATLDDQKKKEIKTNDVKRVIYYNNGNVSGTQEKIRVKTVDKNGNLSKDTDDSFEYLMYDGKIRLYGSNVYTCESSAPCYYTHSNFYIQKSGEPYAVLAVKPKSQFSFKVGSSIENIVDAFRAVGGTCPSFNEYLNDFDKNMMKDKKLDKTLLKEYQDIYDATLKETKHDRAQLRGFFDLVAGRIQSRQAEVYYGIIKEYEKNCP